MTRPVVLLVVLLLAVALTPVGSAYPDPAKVPRYQDSDCFAKYERRFVHDYVGVIDAELGHAVEAAACELYANTGAHFVLVTVPDTQKEPLESYALHLFETWGIGDAKRLDGILLLYVANYDLEGRTSAVRVEVGYGLEGVVTPAIAAEAVRAMRDAKDRALESGASSTEAIDAGLGTGAEYLISTLEDQYVDGHFPAPQKGAFGLAGRVPVWVWVVGIVVLFAVISALSRSARPPSGRGWGYTTGSSQWSSGLGGVFIPRGGGGGWGGGGGGFGGGRSGGGGGSGGF